MYFFKYFNPSNLLLNFSNLVLIVNSIRMDDKVFIFLFLIPGIVLFMDYHLLKKAHFGKRLFYTITSIIVGYIFTIILINWFDPDVFPSLGYLLTFFVLWYFILIFSLILSVIIYFVSKNESR